MYSLCIVESGFNHHTPYLLAPFRTSTLHSYRNVENCQENVKDSSDM